MVGGADDQGIRGKSVAFQGIDHLSHYGIKNTPLAW
jgi:hypothetical protein